MKQGATDMSSSGAQYVWHSKIKMDEEKSRHVGLAPQTVLARHFSTTVVKGTVKPHKYDDCWSLFAISSVSPICSPSFSFMGGVGNK